MNKVLIASGIFHPEAGGPASYLYGLLPALQAAGHSLSVLTYGDPSPADADYPYPLTRVPRSVLPLRRLTYARAAARLWPGHDLVYLHSLGLPLPTAARPRIGKIVGDPAWERALNKGWLPPSTDVDAFQGRRYGPAVELNKALRAREAAHLDRVIVPSEYLRRMVIGWGVAPERVRVIYNAVSLPQASLSQGEARAALGLAARPTLFTPARLTPWKGIDAGLRALAASSLADVQYLIAGEGSEGPALQALAHKLGLAERVHFLGRVGRAQMPLYYRAADFTLLYSGYEGLSHTLIESLLAGTPVIASDKGGNPEVVAHGVNGLLVPYPQAEALPAALAQAFTQAEALRRGTAHNLARFDFGTMLSQTLDALTS